MKKFTRKDLKDGDFVLLRKGVIGVVVKDKEHFIYNNGDWDFVCRFHNDLTDRPGPFNSNDYDIMKVCRSVNVNGFDSAERAFDIDYGIIYDRNKIEKVEEMTLEQVCKALGKNVKIVKG